MNSKKEDINKSPLVSIILPTYNREWCIERAIRSSINQAYKNWELIIIDDGSTDNTKKVIQPYLKDKRIKYFYQKNSHVAAARNNGIKRAKGNYIVFFDSDDEYKKDFIKRGVEEFKRHEDEADFIVFNNYNIGKQKKEAHFPFEKAIVSYKNSLKNEIYWFEECRMEKAKIAKRYLFDEDVFRESVRHSRMRKRRNILYIDKVIRIWHTEGSDRSLFKNKKGYLMQYKGIKRYLNENMSYLKKIGAEKKLKSETLKLYLLGALGKINKKDYIKLNRNYKLKYNLEKLFSLTYLIFGRKLFVILLSTYMKITTKK